MLRMNNDILLSMVINILLVRYNRDTDRKLPDAVMPQDKEHYNVSIVYLG